MDFLTATVMAFKLCIHINRYDMNATQLGIANLQYYEVTATLQWSKANQ